MRGINNEQWQTFNDKLDKLIATATQLSNVDRNIEARLLKLERQQADIIARLNASRPT